MAKDTNMPGFNLDDDLNLGEGQDFSSKPVEEKPEEKPKIKPKLTFEDSAVEQKNTSPTVETTSEAKGKVKKSSKKTWLWITIVLLVIIASGLYFLHSQGHLNWNYVSTQFNKIKNDIFGGSKDTTKVASTAAQDSSKMIAKSEAPGDTKKSGQKIDDVSKLLKAPEKPTDKKVEKKTETPVTKEKSKVNMDKLLKKPQKSISKSSLVEKKSKGTIKPPGKTLGKTRTTPSGKYSVQVSAWKHRSKAQSEANKIRRKGFKVNIQTVSIPEKGGKWYRVLVGTYSSQSEAESQIPGIKKKLNTDCVVREK